jgi:hypothetical protein
MSYLAVTIPTTTVLYCVVSWDSGLQLERAGGTQVYGRLDILLTSGWQAWTTVLHIVNLSTGSLPLGIKATSGSWNINWFTITKA